jgi:hypothetical protein
MTHSLFHALQGGHASEGYALHNARLIDVQPDDAGGERLVVECQGQTVELQGGGRWGEYSRRDVGRMGYLRPAALSFPATYFSAYQDQSLRRAPEFDAPDPAAAAGQAPNVIGWYCDARPTGFRAPVGLVPGENGDFVRDITHSISLQVPQEFVRISREFQLSPSDLLRAFVGDVCGLVNLNRCPRADGYGSNGSDERDMADQWLERAFGHQRIDMDALDAETLAEDLYPHADEVDNLLQEYRGLGGNPEDILETVRHLVDQKRAQS